ncbi:GntR family transcriptional regulator [Nocardioides psychrotolerans]|uniref:DNA-binding transcriptional regulator YhcF, GntR family n=1 Tax=Nocardioides psychrotolerans TaxID=1005945 RepID=A0A1I3BKZ5_9ACTN|nr:GntR family transcriptional regulator [Nocardioides psychrotolerans]GEP36579.1 GntR family transcriptional regulator [Nocardioides psychrotolerans]SFH62938.1 DNA-binding transcriptional regulator YhcF, GntR family [Nocardioides psychrotolerans]
MTVLPLDPALPEPPFEQLRTQIAGRASDGDLPAGTKLPTVRALAEQLGLAPNTVARAYKELEADGVVVTEGRRGTFVAAAAGDGTPADVAAAAAELATAARRSGLTLAQTQRLLDAAWAGPQSART